MGLFDSINVDFPIAGVPTPFVGMPICDSNDTNYNRGATYAILPNGDFCKEAYDSRPMNAEEEAAFEARVANLPSRMFLFKRPVKINHRWEKMDLTGTLRIMTQRIGDDYTYPYYCVEFVLNAGTVVSSEILNTYGQSQ